MSIPEDQDGRYLTVLSDKITVQRSTREGGRREIEEKRQQIIVDQREFRSGLPHLLHVQGFKIVPATLEIGDYVLTPDLCLERKSIPDLISSFTSGRLFPFPPTILFFFFFALNSF